MKIQAEEANPYIYQVVVYIHSGDTYATYRRIKADSSTQDWYDFTAYNNIHWVEMEITDETNPHIYMLLTTGTGPYSLRRMSSADGGATWTTGTVDSNQKEAKDFDICAGPDDYAYLAYFSTSNTFWIGRYKNYFTSVDGFTALATDANFNHPSIASARHNVYPSNYIHVVYQSGSIDDPATRSIEYVSSDGGATYTGPGFFILGDVHTVMPFVACTRYGTSDQFVGIATQYWTSYDSTAMGYKSNQSAAWNNLGFKNQYRATTTFPPQGNYINTGLSGGYAYVYRQYASNNIWYDRASHYNSVEEEISPVTNISVSRGNVLFTFDLNASAKGDIKIFDLSGRNVKNLYTGEFSQGSNSFSWDYRSDGITSGNYIMLLTVPGKTLSEKFSILN